MKILLIPSQWEEAFGRIAIEAMINSIPVIASNIAGLRESVGDREVLVEKNNINEWINKILKFTNRILYENV